MVSIEMHVVSKLFTLTHTSKRLQDQAGSPPSIQPASKVGEEEPPCIHSMVELGVDRL